MIPISLFPCFFLARAVQMGTGGFYSLFSRSV